MINQPFDQQIDNAESLGLKQLAQMQQTNPDFAQAIAFENLKQSLLAHQNQTDMDNRPMGQPADVIGRNELEVREMLAGMGAPPAPAPTALAQMGQPTEPTQMGLPQLSANNLAVRSAAQGGIVGYAQGGLKKSGKNAGKGIKKFPGGETLEQERERYQRLKRLEAKFRAEGNQEALENVQRELENYEGSIAAQPPKPTPENIPQMAGGGIVSLAQGGLLEVGDRTQEGEVIVAMVKGVMGEIPVTEAEYEAWTQGGSLPPNRNVSTPTFRQAIEGGFNVDLPTFAPTPGSPEENLMQGNVLTGPATGNVLKGPGGLASEMGEILDSDVHWSEKVGRGGIATGEAGLQSFLKGIGGGWEGIEYGARLLGGAGRGAGEQLDMKGREQVEAAIESASAQFNLDMAPLIDQLNELQNSDLALDDPSILAIQDQIAAARQAHEEKIASLEATPTLGNAVMNLPQDINKWMQMYEDDPSSTWIGRTLGGIQDVREEQQQAALNEELTRAAQAAQDAAGDRVILSDDDYMLQQIAKALGGSGGSGGSDTGDTGDTGGTGDAPEEEGRSWLDKTMDVMELLGGGAGASTGYVGQKILDTAQEKERFESQQAFEQAMQDQLLQQRTDERQMILDQQRQIERATAMAGITVAEIIMDPLVIAERERLINDVHDEWFGYNEEAVQRDLNAFILRILNQRRQETGALYDAAASGNAPSVSGSSLPPGVTVIKSSP